MCCVYETIRRRAFEEVSLGAARVQWTVLDLSLDVGCILKGLQTSRDSGHSSKCKQRAGLHKPWGTAPGSTDSSAHRLGPRSTSLLSASLITHESSAGWIALCMGRRQTEMCLLSFMTCCRQKLMEEILIVSLVCKPCCHQSFLSSISCCCKWKFEILSIQCILSPCCPAFTLIHSTIAAASLPWIDLHFACLKIPLNYYKVIYLIFSLLL